jgi:hypothetical protein
LLQRAAYAHPGYRKLPKAIGAELREIRLVPRRYRHAVHDFKRSQPAAQAILLRQRC